MSIKDKIREIETAVDGMVMNEDGIKPLGEAEGESFDRLKKSLSEKIKETEVFANDILEKRENKDFKGDLFDKLKEIEDATDRLMALNDHDTNKKKHGEIRKLLNEMREASEELYIDDRMNKE